MKATPAFLLLAVGLSVNALPTSDANHNPAVPTTHTPNITAVSAADKRGSSRFSCGQYKFDDGRVQEFYSQVWAGIPAEQMVCRYFKYEFGSKKGREGTMVAAKVDFGCTCFFYECVSLFQRVVRVLMGLGCRAIPAAAMLRGGRGGWDGRTMHLLIRSSRAGIVLSSLESCSGTVGLGVWG